MKCCIVPSTSCDLPYAYAKFEVAILPKAYAEMRLQETTLFDLGQGHTKCHPSTKIVS